MQKCCAILRLRVSNFRKQFSSLSITANPYSLLDKSFSKIYVAPLSTGATFTEALAANEACSKRGFKTFVKNIARAFQRRMASNEWGF